MSQLSYRRHRFPPEIIQHAIWLYLRFTLSYRDVEELLAGRRSQLSNCCCGFGRECGVTEGLGSMTVGIWRRVTSSSLESRLSFKLLEMLPHRQTEPNFRDRGTDSSNPSPSNGECEANPH